MSTTSLPKSQSGWLVRAHRICGVFPLSLFMLLYVAFSAWMAFGSESFSRASLLSSIPVRFTEMLLVYVPLLFHALYGIYRAITLPLSNTLDSVPAQSSTPEQAPHDALLLRASGMVSALFVALYIYLFRASMLLGGTKQQELYSRSSALLSATTELGVPVTAVVVLLGTLACALHLHYGLKLWLGSADSAWLTNGDDARVALLVRASAILSGSLFLVSVLSTLELATGSVFP